MQKNAKKYSCFFCDFTSNNLYNFEKHNETKKHKMTVLNNMNNKKCKKMQKNAIGKFVCICGKEYVYNSGLSAHKKKCRYIPDNIIQNLEEELVEAKKENEHIQNKFIDSLEQQVIEKDKQLKELIPKVGDTYTFNMNNFLNEQCKDAMSIEDFMNKIAITLENLLVTQQEGISTGISHLIIDNIQKLSLQERPIHCSDKKREILYIKNDIWEKDINKMNTKKMIDKLCNKHVQSINELVHDENTYLDLMKTCTSDLNNKKVMKELCESVYVTNNESNDSDDKN